MMGSERVVGVRADGGNAEVTGIVPQSLVELFRLLEERAEAGSGQEDGTEAWAVRVGYLQVCTVYNLCALRVISIRCSLLFPLSRMCARLARWRF